MKNILKLLPLILLLLTISCSDDDNKPVSIIGTWKFTGTYEYVTDTFVPADTCLETLKTFHDNGHGINNYADLCNPSIIAPIEFTWLKEDNDNYYTITTSDNNSTTVKITFEGNNKMTISIGDDSSTTYERK